MPPLLGGLVELVLRHVDCAVSVAPSAPEHARAGGGIPDALLVDLDVGASGRDGARTVVGLTRRWETPARLAAVEAGIDDLVRVPFSPDEIVVRTIAALRRATGRTATIVPRSRVGAFELDVLERGVRRDGDLVRLTVLEQTLLYLFLSHPGETLERASILANVWGTDSAVTSNVIDRHIRDLRVKLNERWREPTLIETVPGVGYRFIGQRTGGMH